MCACVRVCESVSVCVRACVGVRVHVCTCVCMCVCAYEVVRCITTLHGVSVIHFIYTSVQGTG